MKKKTNGLCTLTTIVTLLPVILSAILYNELPAQIAIHFNNAGVADNYLPKNIAIFGLPVFLAVLNISTHFSLNNDPKKANASAVMKYVAKWSIPLISLIVMPITLFIAMGYKIPIQIIIPVIVGLLIVILGNYLPKCKQNYTIGIKLPWTLNDEENWNRTHHLAGYLWTIAGIILIIGSFLKFTTTFMILIIVIVLVAIPFMYSFYLYKKNL